MFAPRLSIQPQLILRQMTNISAMELNEVRPFFSLAMKRLVALDPEEQGSSRSSFCSGLTRCSPTRGGGGKRREL
jgi:hypothetical protein